MFPINLNFPNERNIPDYDPEFPVSELVKDTPRLMKKQAELLKEELSSTTITFEKKELIEDMCGVRHNEAKVEWRFDTPESDRLPSSSEIPPDINCLQKQILRSQMEDEPIGVEKVQCLACSVYVNYISGVVQVAHWMRFGLERRGNISTEIVKDGRVERAGWASVKLEDRKFLNRKKYLWNWKNFSHLLIKCRGDGRSYKIMLHAPKAIDMTWGDSYSYPLHTRGGPYWQYEKIPFSKFFHTVAGRIQDKQNSVFLDEVSSLGIVLMDRIDGEFQLELDYIGVYNDQTHFEKFAYETYTLPLFNTHGI
ncbi:Complex I intermediate-associated protein 30 [Cooperia oncophora]